MRTGRRWLNNRTTFTEIRSSMRASKYFLATILMVIPAALCFAVRQRTLNSLRSDNESLRQQIESRGAAPSDESAPTDSATSLSVEERNELLRLRNKGSSLRRELGNAVNRP